MKRLLIATVILAGLGGAIWWSEKQEAAKKDLPDPKAAPKILALKEEDVRQIELQRAGEAATVLVKDDAGKWSILAPAGLTADVTAIAGLSGAVTTLASERLIDENLTDLAAYGLDPAVVSVKLTMKDGTTHLLRIGGETPDKSSVYASVDGDKRLFALATFNKDSLNKSARDLREKHLLSFDTDTLSRVELNVPGKPALEFSRTGDAWQILKPRPLRADGLAVDELVRQLKDAEMDTSAEDKQATTAFASGKPHATARVTTAGGVLTLEVRKSGDDYYAHSSALTGAFKVTPALGTGVNKTLEDFQNKKLFDFAFDDPNKIHYKSKDDDKTFEKNGTDWLANGRAMDSVGVQNLIDKLRDLSAGRVDDASMTSSDIEITVVSKDGKRNETIALKESGADFLARRGTEAGIYHIDGSTITSLKQAVTGIQESAPVTKDGKKAPSK